jgi:hypothetical protein
VEENGRVKVLFWNFSGDTEEDYRRYQPGQTACRLEIKPWNLSQNIKQEFETLCCNVE